MRRKTRKHQRLLAALVLVVTVASPFGLAPEPVFAERTACLTSPTRRPSRTQMKRLSHLEPYIRYFSSLGYGPERSRVSADFIRALIITESGGDTWAVSARDARGVTQLTAATAAVAARELLATTRDFLFIDESVLVDLHPNDLFDPALNILLACYLNATYHARYEGRTELVVSAWNAGPGAVARYGNRPPPYPETRNAILRVQDYMAYFETLQVN